MQAEPGPLLGWDLGLCLSICSAESAGCPRWCTELAAAGGSGGSGGLTHLTGKVSATPTPHCSFLCPLVSRPLSRQTQVP